MIPWILLVALLLLLPVAGVAQSDEGTTAVPRTPWGHPDLQGIWNNATTTPLERPSDLAGKEFLTAEEVAGRDAQVAQTRSTDRLPEKVPLAPTTSSGGSGEKRRPTGERR